MIRKLLALSLVASAPAFAGSEVNFGASSEYVFRGITQSDGAQVWGSLDYSFGGTGLYTGIWISNAGLAGNEEVDVYGGYALGLGERFSLDIGAIGYFDPSAPESATAINNAEGYLGVNARIWNVYAYYNFGRAGREDDEFVYTEANVMFSLLPDAKLRLHAGYLLGVGDVYDALADDDYIDYGIGFIKDYGDSGQITFAVTATTIDEGHGLAGEFAVSDRPQFTVGWSRAFGAAF